ncbi:hypothetical protein RM96_07130 [Cupriavidus sp. IDO]|nr:hypothetical protein RM96_07130 [Cupriavidus sp. IDO]
MGFTAAAHATEVTFAGLAYSGDEASVTSRFPYSRQFQARLGSGTWSAYAQLQRALAALPPADFTVNTKPMAQLQGQDQVVVLSLVINNETVSVERIGGLQKLLTQIRGQALFFDFKSMTVLRSYPLSFAVIDVLDHEPSDEEKLKSVQTAYLGAAGKPGVFSRFAYEVSKAKLPNTVPRFVQVAKVEIGDKAMENLPASLTSTPGTAQTWFADLLAEAISSKTDTPILPYSKGYAIGNVMSMRIDDSTVFQLKIPTADYEITLDVEGLKKVKYGEAPAGASYIYASFASVRMEQPLAARPFLDSKFKNGEVKVVPVTQQYVDDFPAYSDSVRGLFNKLGESLAGKSSDWLKSSASASDINSQVKAAQQVLKSCQ